jgi:uracil-DNA glycosylase
MKKIHPLWITIFRQYKSDIIRIFEELCELDNITPPIENIFETFMLSPEHIKVVIIGQDPFSTNSISCPASLKNILLSMKISDTGSYDFHNLLYQGVLLLNMSLTTCIGTSNSHTGIWGPFVNNIISTFTQQYKQSITFMLWGNDAKKMKQHIKGSHTILEWSHPSPIADNEQSEDKKFKNCDHFSLTQQINWNCLEDIHTIYTDGAVKMAEPCVSSYGIYIGSGVLKGLEISGRVRSCKYVFNTGTISPDPTEFINCTAQRGEYLALCIAINMCININLPSPIRIISDSRNALMTMMEWYGKKKDKSKFSNLDLVTIMCNLFDKLNSMKKVELSHIKSHQKEDGSEDVRCNNHVDKIAKIALSFSNTDLVCNSSVIKFIH